MSFDYPVQEIGGRFRGAKSDLHLNEIQRNGITIMRNKIVALTFLIAAIVACRGTVTMAGQKTTVGRAVPANQQVSMDQIDHSPWNQLLQKHVNEQGEVNYQAWHASATDRQTLDGYLNLLSTASTTTQAAPESQFAFWINAYNAVTIRGILQEYPTASIRNHTAKLVGYNIWKDLLLIVGDTKISLNDMEHEVLRKMGDPRIHFAIVCASHSCPRLLNQAYVAQNLEDQLVLNTKAFFANPENFQYDANQRQFRLSSILDWFASDFGNDQATQLKTIAPYLPSPAAYDAATRNSVRVSHLEYDWSLNEQKQTQQAATGSTRR